MSKLILAGDFPQADDEAWLALAKKALKGADFDKTLVSHTSDGLEIKPLYTRNDELDAAPFTRGFGTKTGEPPWHIRQLHATAGPDATNAAILQDLEGGATAIALQIAAPGQNGLKLSSTEDLERALDGVALDLAGVWLEAGHNCAQAAASALGARLQGGGRTGGASGGCGADPMGAMARTWGHPWPLERALGEMAGLAARTHARTAQVTAVLVDARPYHDGGASEAQELSCLCATMIAYLRAMESEGLAPQDGLAQMEFALSCDADMFSTIAKLRAARALIARIAEVAGAGEALPRVRLHATTSLRMFSRLDSHVNILRTTIAAASAIFGGADSLSVLPFTYAHGQPDAFARRIARNIQIILQEEASLGAVSDPAGGSWYVESLTQKFAEKAWELFQTIEAEGGMGRALAEGTIQTMLAKSADDRAREIALGRQELTGVTAFPDLDAASVEAGPHPLPDDLEDPAMTLEPIPLRRPAEPFERLRAASNAYLEVHKQRPKIALLTFGQAARATYAESFFAAGGIETVRIDDPQSYDKSLSPIACICASDDEGVHLAKALKKSGAKHIYSAGRPGGLRRELEDAGVGGFIHRGCDIIAALEAAHDVLGLKVTSP